MLLNGQSHASSLVAQHLARAGFQLLGQRLTPELPLAALAKINVGLAHAEGEQILAFYSVDETLGMFAVVTDRRLAGQRGNHPVFDVRFADMHQTEIKSGMLNPVTKVLTSRGWQDATIDKHKPLGDLLNAMMQLHPQQREPPPNPLCTPSPQDPAGAHAALQRVDAQSLAALLIRSVGLVFSVVRWLRKSGATSSAAACSCSATSSPAGA